MTAAAEPHIDIISAKPLRLIIELSDGSLVDLVPLDGVGKNSPLDRVVRIQASDLRATCRQTSHLHTEAAARGDVVTVLVDIEVGIDHDVHAARRSVANLDSPRTPETLRYVGTAAGLAGLIADIHALQLADGVALLPLTTLARDLTIDQALPQLATMGIDIAGCPVDTMPLSTADRFHESWSARAVQQP